MHGVFVCLVWSLWVRNPPLKTKFMLTAPEAPTGISCAEQLDKIWAGKMECQG